MTQEQKDTMLDYIDSMTTAIYNVRNLDISKSEQQKLLREITDDLFNLKHKYKQTITKESFELIECLKKYGGEILSLDITIAAGDTWIELKFGMPFTFMGR